MKLRRKGLQPIKLDLFTTNPIKPQRKITVNSSLQNSGSSMMTETDKNKPAQDKESTPNNQPKKEEEVVYSTIENVETSQFTYTKLVFLQRQILFVLLVILYLGFLLAQVEDRADGKWIVDLLFGMMTLSTVVLGVLVSVRKIVDLQLQIDQKSLYHFCGKTSSKFPPPMRALLSGKSALFLFLFELFLVLIHPTVFTKDMLLSVYDDFYQLTLDYKLNHLLELLMLCKYFVFLRTIINLTKYAKPRVKRVCNNNQIQYSLMYSIKCIWSNYPIRSIVVTVMFLLVVFSYGLRITEGKVSLVNPIQSNGFEVLSNCFWFSFVTMYGIGYGQHVPTTILGRLLASNLAVLGVGINSMLVVSVCEYLTMSKQEEKSLSLVHRLQNRAYMEACAVKVLSKITKLTQFSYNPDEQQKAKKSLNQTYEEIKGGVDKTKEYRLLIKNVKSINDGNEMMIHDFSMLRESCLQISARQSKIQLFLQQNRPSQQLVSTQIHEQFRQFIMNTLGMHQQK